MTFELSRRRFVQVAAGTMAAMALPKMALAQERQEAIIAVQTNPSWTEPLREIDNVGFRVLFSVFDYLITTDQRTGEQVPGLATEWKRIDDRTLELKLREGVKFHNGDIMTAEDVAFSFGPKRLLVEDAPAYGATRYAWGNLQEVQVVDPMTVRFVAKVSDPIIETRIANWCGQIISKRAFEEAGEWDAWSRMAVGTGPMKVVENRPGEFIRLEAFDEYWGGRPEVSAVTFKVVPEVSSRIAGLATGEYHVATDIPPDQFQTIEGHDGFEVVGGPIMNHRVVTFDCRNPIIAKPEVRRAIGLAIDREAIVEALWAGRVNIPRSHQFEVFGELYNTDRPPACLRPRAGQGPAAAGRLRR